MQPTVTVLVPFRDAGDTIDAAFDGLLASGDPQIRVLALDDGSTDAGPGRVAARAARDARVAMIQCNGNGLVAALQRGCAETQTEFVARMDADDTCHPQRIARQLDHLRSRPRVGALGCLVEAAGDVGEGLRLYVEWQNGLRSPADHRRELFVEAPLCHPSVVLRRCALEQVGGYRALDGPEDYDLWLRLDEAGWDLAKLPETLLQWRHAPGRATFSDARYGFERFRAIKAPHLARWVKQRRTGGWALWGAGPTGKRLARALEPHGVRPDFFVDIDPRKVGSTARAKPIRNPDALDARQHAVVVAVGARGARELIRADLRARGYTEGPHFVFAA